MLKQEASISFVVSVVIFRNASILQAGEVWINRKCEKRTTCHGLDNTGDGMGRFYLCRIIF